MASLREHIGAQPCNRGRNQPHDEVVGRTFQAERSARAKTLKSEPVWQIEGQAGLVWMERRPQGDTGRGRQSGRPGLELTACGKGVWAPILSVGQSLGSLHERDVHFKDYSIDFENRRRVVGGHE